MPIRRTGIHSLRRSRASRVDGPAHPASFRILLRPAGELPGHVCDVLMSLKLRSLRIEGSEIGRFIRFRESLNLHFLNVAGLLRTKTALLETWEMATRRMSPFEVTWPILIPRFRRSFDSISALDAKSEENPVLCTFRREPLEKRDSLQNNLCQR
jgi:hypothetical protein